MAGLNSMMFDWDQISTIFLDMDGTLLDLHFDNYFWLEHVPLRYGELNGLTFAHAKEELLARYSAVEGTLQWYCVDYWTKELKLNITQLKGEVADKILIHAHVEPFLESLRHSGKSVVLLTNAHENSVNLKLDKTGLGKYFNRIIISHHLNRPKEEPAFWPLLQQAEAYEPLHTLLVDDNLNVLKAAETYGINYLLAIKHPDTAGPPVETGKYLAIDDFRKLIIPN